MTRTSPLPIALMLLLAPGAAEGAPADPPGAPPRAERLVEVEIAADTERIGPGERFHLAVIFTIAPHWHTYWINPGASGGAPEVAVEAPGGFTVGVPLFPRPTAFQETLGRTYGYEKETVLFIPITAPDRLDEGEAVFEARVLFLVCREVCLIGEEKRALRLPTVARSGGDGEPVRDARLERYRRRLPRPISDLPRATAQLEPGRLVITGPAGDHAEIEFLPIDRPGVTFGAPALTVAGGRFRAEVPVEIRPSNALGQPIAVRGVVGLGRSADGPCYHFDLPVETTP